MLDKQFQTNILKKCDISNWIPIQCNFVTQQFCELKFVFKIKDEIQYVRRMGPLKIFQGRTRPLDKVK